MMVNFYIKWMKDWILDQLKIRLWKEFSKNYLPQKLYLEDLKLQHRMIDQNYCDLKKDLYTQMVELKNIKKNIHIIMI